MNVKTCNSTQYFDIIRDHKEEGLEPGVNVTTLLFSWLELLFFIILLRNLLKIVGCITTANWTCSVCLQPFVDTFSMKLVRAGQHPNHLPSLEVRHADDTDGLVTLTGVPLLGRIPAEVRS